MRRWKRRSARTSSLVTFAAIVLASGGVAAQQAPRDDERSETRCITNREELLALDQQSFDQDPNGGWRPIAARAECRSAAADLIREYRDRATATLDIEQREGESAADARRRIAEERFSILFWHEGQLRAFEGETDVALEVFRRSYQETSDPTWRRYAEATIAFLERDRQALELALEQLEGIPVPDGWDEQAAAIREEHGFEVSWPPNLDVVEGLLRCFEEPYSVAYGEECRGGAR